MKAKVKDSPHLYRDEATNAIINTNKADYEKYMTAKKIKEKEQRRIETLENEIKSVKNDIQDIKDLIIGLYKDK